MKITRSYLKQIIKEELESSEPLPEELSMKLLSVVPDNYPPSGFAEAVVLAFYEGYGEHNLAEFKETLLKMLQK
jgi:hypothetical protein